MSMLRTPNMHSSPHLSALPTLPVPRVIITPCTPVPPGPGPSLYPHSDSNSHSSGSSSRHARNRSTSSRSSQSQSHASSSGSGSSGSSSRVDSARSRNLMEAMSMGEPDTQLLAPPDRRSRGGHHPSSTKRTVRSPVITCIFLALALVLIMSSIVGIGEIKAFSLIGGDGQGTGLSGARRGVDGYGYRDGGGGRNGQSPHSITFRHERDLFRRRDVKERHARLSQAMSYEWLGDRLATAEENKEGQKGKRYESGPTSIMDAWDFH